MDSINHNLTPIVNATELHYNTNMTDRNALGGYSIKHDRITPARMATCAYFETQSEPVDYGQVLNYLKDNNVSVNKTTVYRQLDYLLQKGLIRELDFGEGKKRYELAKGHHHHLICVNCNDIQCVEIKEDFEDQEIEIGKKTNFKISGHRLEFFGLCSACQQEVK